MMLLRVGEHSGLAEYAFVKSIARLASASRLGVRWKVLPEQLMSRPPRSSARMNTTFGLAGGSAAGVGDVPARTMRARKLDQIMA